MHWHHNKRIEVELINNSSSSSYEQLLQYNLLIIVGYFSDQGQF